MTIPNNRAVRGGDIATIERRLGLRPADMQWVLGANTHAYYDLLPKSGKDEREIGIAQSLILRFLDNRPDCLPLIRPPRASELLALLQDINPDMTKRHLAVLLGRDGATGYRWLAKDSGKVMRQEALRWSTMVYLALSSAPPGRRKMLLDELFDMVVLEASLRGYDPKALREQFVFRTPSDLAKAKKARAPSEKAERMAAAEVIAKPAKPKPAKAAKAKKTIKRRKPARKATRADG